MVFQSYALYPHMSVYDNMAFGLKLRKTPKTEIDRRVKEAGSILGIENLLDRKPKQLSGGQRQRVALGRAIVREPAVFLMDEPLSNLDAKLRVQTRAEISKLHQRLETTFIYVTHDQVEAMTMGSRICVLKDGKMMQIDTPQNLYDKPDNVFVGGFIGSPAMNFFDVTLVGQEGDIYVDGGSFRLKLPPDRTQAVALRGQAGDLWHPARGHSRRRVCAARHPGRADRDHGGRDGADGQRDLCLSIDRVEAVHRPGRPPHAGPRRHRHAGCGEHGQHASLRPRDGTGDPLTRVRTSRAQCTILDSGDCAFSMEDSTEKG
jgi:energy-coupling factor transporter ATP-binding protein EcfA2